MNRHAELVEWYGNHIDVYTELTSVAERTVRDLVDDSKIDYLNVTSRTKSLRSLMEKVERKGYSNPQAQNTDLAAVRIIAYVESDVRKICELIQYAFSVHAEDSGDKTDALDVDRVGYRSVHFICDLGESRLKLPEFSRFRDVVFEIQVRTMLQHAWAEIHYNRDYKFSGVLPRRISRQLYCLAGALELADMNFSALASEIDNYAEEISERVRRNDLQIDINSLSLPPYLSHKLKFLEVNGVQLVVDEHISRMIVEELQNFGVHSLKDLDAILNEQFLESIINHQTYTTYVGLMRDAMLVEDIDLYFANCWNSHWQEAESYTFEILKERYDGARVELMFRERGIRWS